MKVAVHWNVTMVSVVKITICPSMLQVLLMLLHFLVLFQMDEINVQLIISYRIMSAP